ncbi:hypothetical protein ATE84_3815 [Aquimarina sp. MAR_2010_214]|uniref:hypothetical protein n=1 Tax=Aquimarina sp. MAR_2010_214 TaxID=1250026 RepID=UPI000C7044A8|nr:hypothetical protein [Aquimarina sp. MAR_2010_214]PKV51717.1 hypothetical protein ATE84_3815 [Aquimarina sp. MAR_2010_214]
MKKIICITVLSSLIFLSISFLTVLNFIFTSDSPEFKIGFPLQYYNRFFTASDELRFSWNIWNLLVDILIVWGITVLVYYLQKRINK